jgi:hypothetical protein
MIVTGKSVSTDFLFGKGHTQTRPPQADHSARQVNGLIGERKVRQTVAFPSFRVARTGSGYG